MARVTKFMDEEEEDEDVELNLIKVIIWLKY